MLDAFSEHLPWYRSLKIKFQVSINCHRYNLQNSQTAQIRFTKAFSNEFMLKLKLYSLIYDFDNSYKLNIYSYTYTYWRFRTQLQYIIETPALAFIAAETSAANKKHLCCNFDKVFGILYILIERSLWD